MTVETTNPEWIAVIVSCVVNVIVAVWTYFTKKDAANAKDLRALELRMAKLEETVRHMPDSEVMGQVIGDIRGLKATMDGIKASIDPLTASVNRVTDYLLNHK